jgi:acetyltransferase-like isoleucine patch superfamily enzyme
LTASGTVRRLPRAVARRAKTAGRRAALAVDAARPLRRTALAVATDLPPPAAFAAWPADSWLVPPARVHNAHRIAIGKDGVILEHSVLWVFDAAIPPEGPLLVLGDQIRLGRFNTVLAEVSVVIGDGVSSSDGVSIADTWRSPHGEASEAAMVHRPPAPVVIGAGSYLGMGSVIGPGVHIGEGAYVGELAVVLDDVPPHTVVYGNPASVVRRYDPEAATWDEMPWA